MFILFNRGWRLLYSRSHGTASSAWTTGIARPNDKVQRHLTRPYDRGSGRADGSSVRCNVKLGRTAASGMLGTKMNIYVALAAMSKNLGKSNSRPVSSSID